MTALVDSIYLFQIQCDLQLVQLLLGNRGRRAAHHVATGVVLREGDEVADAVGATEERAETVEAEGQTSVRRCAVLEGTHQEAELLLRLLVGEAEGVEHLVLQGAVVDTDGAATDLHTVHHDVVGIGTDVAPLRRIVEQGLILGLGCGKGMVHSIIALRLLIPFQEREVDDPQWSVFVGFTQTKLVTHLQT